MWRIRHPIVAPFAAHASQAVPTARHRTIDAAGNSAQSESPGWSACANHRLQRRTPVSRRRANARNWSAASAHHSGAVRKKHCPCSRRGRTRHAVGSGYVDAGACCGSSNKRRIGIRRQRRQRISMCVDRGSGYIRNRPRSPGNGIRLHRAGSGAWRPGSLWRYAVY